MADWEIHGIAYALDIIITWSSSNLAGHALALDVVSIQEIVLSLWTLRGALLLFPEITSIVANNQGVGGDTRNEHFRVGLEVFFFCIVHFIPQALRIFCGHSCARLFTGTVFWILLRALSFLPSFQNPHGIRAVTSFLRPSSSPKVQILRLAYQNSFFILQVMACDIVGEIFPFARTSIIFGGGFELIPPCTARFSSAMVTTISANYLPNGTLLAQRGQNLRRVVETRRS